jgi:hypothetical protein
LECKKSDDNIESVKKILQEENRRWFIPILNNDGTLRKLLHEEIIWSFIDEEYEKGTPYKDLKNLKISDVIKFIDEHPEKVKGLVDIYVPIKMDTNACDANDFMQKRGFRLAIITDGKGKPTHFITSGDIRRLLLQRG